MEKVDISDQDIEALPADRAQQVINGSVTEDYSVLVNKAIPNLILLAGGVGITLFTYFLTSGYPEILSICAMGFPIFLFLALIGGVRLVKLAKGYSHARLLWKNGAMIEASIHKFNDQEISEINTNAFSFTVNHVKYVIRQTLSEKDYQNLHNHTISIKARYVPSNPSIARIYTYPAATMQTEPVVHAAAAPMKQEPSVEKQTLFGNAAKNYPSVLLRTLGGAALTLFSIGYIIYIFVIRAHGDVGLMMLSMLGIVIGPIFALFQARDFRNAKLVHDRGEAVSGTVMKKWTETRRESSGGRGSSTRTIYSIQYEFSVSSTAYVIQQQVGQSQYDRLQVGSNLEVRYLPENPLVCRAEN